MDLHFFGSKYREKCHYQHSDKVCEVQNCNKKCSKRHPRECRYQEKCKFQEKNICEYSHVSLVLETIDEVGANKIIENKVKEMLELMNDIKADIELKINDIKYNILKRNIEIQKIFKSIKTEN